MNHHLQRLQPYPFQKLTELFAGTTPNPDLKPINLSIGEPRHETPALVKDALVGAVDGLASYPMTAGTDALRQAIAGWLLMRYGLRQLDWKTQVLPVNGSREALFAFAQTVVDGSRPDPVVVAPNPFYQIYEGAALMAGARLWHINTLPEQGFALDFAQVPDEVWAHTQLVYVCSPNNPTGRVMPLEEWRRLFELSDRHGFIIAADECYSEIYFDEERPPLGALEAAQRLGRDGYPRLVAFSSLSKRSNVPGMRSGFVAGDAAVLERFLQYRTYHGCAMSLPMQAASIVAWGDEAHVRRNRALYREKFERATPVLASGVRAAMPEAGFYYWARTPVDDRDFALTLYREYNVTVLPGSFLAREARGVNPGAGFVRIAMVAPLDDCLAAVERIAQCGESLAARGRVRCA